MLDDGDTGELILSEGVSLSSPSRRVMSPWSCQIARSPEVWKRIRSFLPCSQVHLQCCVVQRSSRVQSAHCSLALLALALALALLLEGWHPHPRPRPAAPSVPRGVRVYLVLPCTSACLPLPVGLSVCPWFALCRRLVRPQSHCSIFPRCSPPFVYALCYSQLVALETRPVCFLNPPYIRPRLVLPIPAHTQRHAPCCPPPHHHHHGSLDIQQPPHPLAKQCSATARMGDRQCHVKSINSSRQCNTATPAPALLFWHTSTADHPPTKQSFAPQ